MKVAFIYNFAKFTEWPVAAFSSPQSPLTLCLPRAKDSYPSALTGIEGKSVQGRVLHVKYMVSSDKVKACQLLYLSEADEGRMQEMLHTLAASPVLTIGDIDKFADAGGMIGFVAVDSNLRFEVNLDAARRANMNFSAHLLKLARIVRDGDVKGK